MAAEIAMIPPLHEEIPAAVMHVEVFSTPGCAHCARITEVLEALSEEIGTARIEWRVVNVVDELDYAVRLGVLATPSIVIDGEVVFAGVPSISQLRDRLNEHIKGVDE